MCTDKHGMSMQASEESEDLTEPNLPLHRGGWAGAGGVWGHPPGPPAAAGQQPPDLCPGHWHPHRRPSAPDRPVT